MKLIPNTLINGKFSERGDCSHYNIVEFSGRDAIDFTWSKNCLADQYEKEIVFKIINNDGQQIAEEKIKFQIKENGYYLLIDAI